MTKNRKRKRERDKPKSEGIPISKLGGEFEWIDERLRIGLEAYPTFKRPLGKAEMSMVLSLGLYYDDITKKWEPLSARDISTVRNQGRFYPIPPAELIVDQWNDLLIDKNQNLLCHDVILDNVMRGITEVLIIPLQGIKTLTVESDDYLIDHISMAVYDVVGTNTNITIEYMLPDNGKINIANEVGVSVRSLFFYKTIDWSKFYIEVVCGTGSSVSIEFHFQKYQKYYP